MNQETYPTDNSGTTANLSYTFDSMGRLNTMTDNVAMQELIQGATYGPANELTSITGGSYGGAWAGESRGYNSLKQLIGITSGSVGVSYAYPATGNNGKISSQTDAVSGETVTYTYDALNRLATAATQPSFSTPWGQSFTYDGFGNLTNVAVTQGSAPTFTATYDANNHAGGEDANGNPGSIELPAYGVPATATYDVENRLTGINGGGDNPVMFYSYAPGNKRVWRGNWTYSGGDWSINTDEVTFWSVSGQKLGAYALTTVSGTSSTPQFYATQVETNYYFGAKLIKNANGWVYTDRLGSIGKFYPYGQERPSATTNGTEKFTGYFRDAESGNDYAVNRYATPGYGRFLTPDPYRASKGGADPAHPGSWNRYAYVQGDPINFHDPHGLFILAATDDSGPGDGSGGEGGGDGGNDDSDLYYWYFQGGGPSGSSQGLQTEGSSGGDIKVAGFSTSGNNYNRVTTVLQELETALSGDTTGCASWLGGSGGAAAAVTLVQTLLDNPTLYGTGNFSSPLDYAINGNTNADGTPTGVPDGTLITVNNNGAFFTAFSNGQQLPAVGGVYNAGTPAAQAAILLHELGHSLMPMGFQNDNGNQTAVNSNGNLVSTNCGKLINTIQ